MSSQRSEEIREARRANPKMRERDLATMLDISEAELVAAHIGDGVRRIEPDLGTIFPALKNLGEVMALTRNPSAVHEKIGRYENYIGVGKAAMVLGPQVDLRIFPRYWVHAFAVEKHDEDAVRRSLQFFDAAGEAIHKVHLRPASNVDAYEALVERVKSADQSTKIVTEPYRIARRASDLPNLSGFALDELRRRWLAMNDTHQFAGVLNALDIDRLQAVRSVGDDLAWPLSNCAVDSLIRLTAKEDLPVMVFIRNRGCIQIHSGPIETVRQVGPWLNVMDPDFHMHFRTDHVAEVWAVRKPTDKGHVTSVEAYDVSGEMIVQFFGKRIEGQDERSGWRLIAENLPRLTGEFAA